VSSPSGNANRLMCVGQASGSTGVFLTENALDPAGPTWIVIHTPTADPKYLCCAMTDPDGDGAYLWGDRDIPGHRSGIAFWDGTTVLDKRGTTFTTARVVGIAGG
jgi:hypothetical protein